MRILIMLLISCCTVPLYSMNLIPVEETNGWHQSWEEYKAGLRRSLTEQRAPDNLDQMFGRQTVAELLVAEVMEMPSDEAAVDSSEELLRWIFQKGYEDNGRALLSSLRGMRELHEISRDEYEERWKSRGFSTLVSCLFASNLNATNYRVSGPGGASVLHYLALNAALLDANTCFVREVVSRSNCPGNTSLQGSELDAEELEPSLADALQDRGLLDHGRRLIDSSRNTSPLTIYLASCRLEGREANSDVILLLNNYIVPIHCPEE